MKKRQFWIKLFLSISVLLIFLSLGAALWLWAGYERTSIPYELIPTAEYLMKNPATQPDFLNSFPQPGSTVKSGDWTYVCLSYNPQYEDLPKLQATYNWTRLYLNGQRLPQSEISGSHFGTITGACLQIGYSSHLPSGLYLFRVQVSSSLNEFFTSDPKLSYEWAYRVE